MAGWRLSNSMSQHIWEVGVIAVYHRPPLPIRSQERGQKAADTVGWLCENEVSSKQVLPTQKSGDAAKSRDSSSN
jgi:hypothetical protein